MPLNRNDLVRTIAILLLTALILTALVAALTLATDHLIVRARGNLSDFYPHYTAAQALLRSENPYSQAVTDRIQTGMFGGVLPPDFDQQRFSYPAYSALLLTPFALLPPSHAIALWMSLQLLSILASCFIWIFILEWKPSVWLLPFGVGALVVVFRYPMNAYVLGQFTGIVFLLISLAVLALKNRYDILAGILLALATNPPTIAFGIAALVLCAYAFHRRRRGLASFGVTLILLVAITTLQIGWWLPQFLGVMRDYSRYAYPVWIGSSLPVWLVVPLLALLGWSVLNALTRDKKPSSLALHTDGAALSILAALLLLPQTGNYYLTLLIAPLLLIIKRALERRGRERILILLGCFITVLLPWVIWLSFDHYREVEELVLPLSVFVLWWVQVRTNRAVEVVETASGEYI